jgi:GntR family transcriptional repressor for pyruvate dehydrogenase complex
MSFVAPQSVRVPSGRRVRPSTSDYLTEEILGIIRSEKLNAGDRLPALRALATRLAVTVPTLRESLRRLQALGIVEIVHGSGVYVLRPEPRALLANPYLGPLDPRAIFELLDARILIEPSLTRLAARNARAADFDALGLLVERAARLLEGEDDQLFHLLNREFHAGLARLSGNTILAETVDSLLEIHSVEQMATLRLFDDRRRDLEQHREIYVAARKREAKRASELMRRHLEGVRSIVAARLSTPVTARGGRRRRARGVDIEDV